MTVDNQEPEMVPGVHLFLGKEQLKNLRDLVELSEPLEDFLKEEKELIIKMVSKHLEGIKRLEAQKAIEDSMESPIIKPE